MKPAHAMKRSREEQVEYLRNIMLTNIRALVDREDAIVVDEKMQRTKVFWEVSVDESDMGSAIGTRGAHVDAIRTILHVACNKTEFKIDLTIVSRNPRGRGEDY